MFYKLFGMHIYSKEMLNRDTFKWTFGTAGSREAASYLQQFAYIWF